MSLGSYLGGAGGVSARLQWLTQRMLKRMAREGWYGPGPARDARHDMPLPWDINNGLCEEWAEAAVELVGGDAEWLDSLDPNCDFAHAVLVLDGRYYDAQTPRGVTDWHELPLVRGVGRGA